MPVRQDKSEPSALSSSLAGYVFLFLAVASALMSHFRDWYGVLGLAIGGIALLFVGSGRVYRPAVTRTPDAISCGYHPWREGSVYVLLVAGAGMGIAMLSQARGWLRLAAVVLFVSVALGLLFYLRQARRCLLRITTASLTVAAPEQGYALTGIPRDRIISITGGTGARTNGDTGPVTQIAYLAADANSAAPSTVLIGPTGASKAMWVTVEQSDLLAGLQEWQDGDPSDPALLDRVAALLRGDVTAVAARPITAHAVSPTTPPGSPDFPPAPSAHPSRWRGLRYAAIGAAVVIGASAYPVYQSVHRPSDGEKSVSPSTQPSSSDCSVDGARMVALPKKNSDEPTVYLPLKSGWTEQPSTGNPADTPNLRGLFAAGSIRDDDFTPVIQVDLVRTKSTGSLSAIAGDLFAKARTLMTVANESTGTVCGSTVYRADTDGYNPDGKGDRSGTTLLTVVDGTGGARWVAIASIKAVNTDSGGYRAQRQALIDGFHAGFA
jgi:hypothetical protein